MADKSKSVPDKKVKKQPLVAKLYLIAYNFGQVIG